jgi:hypothetical protein
MGSVAKRRSLLDFECLRRETIGKTTNPHKLELVEIGHSRRGADSHTGATNRLIEGLAAQVADVTENLKRLHHDAGLERWNLADERGPGEAGFMSGCRYQCNPP